MSNQDVSKYYADEQVIRLIAAQVVIIAIISLLTKWTFPLLFLTADLALRAFSYQPTPLAAVGKITSHLLKLKSKPIFAIPKKFAAALGFAFSLTTSVFLLSHLYLAAYITGGILIFCAVLESVFKVCIGCYIYNRIVAPVVNKRNHKSLR